MKQVFAPILLGMLLTFSNCNAGSPAKTNTAATSAGAVIVLTNETFKTKVFDYEKNTTWKYEGNLPAIVDFYADWCAPCRRLSPLVEEIAIKYKGKIVVYKVDTDAQQKLAQSMGVSSLPTLLFIPVKGQPRSSLGALPKESLEKAIQEVLLVQ